ncbi:Uncharacterised protein [Candidatus Bilamarchaeum dharawalense]|uniref:Uncharacterized protein n=1 Tax=Candidatus Bilamarchaeum dharawalense TaxID=2885759 RepID=A0A5E4LUD3_9ARCH|nr:Uncharacterised protein [Candidatus Bilamarchaeum dharawalense]
MADPMGDIALYFCFGKFHKFESFEGVGSLPGKERSKPTKCKKCGSKNILRLWKIGKWD